MRRLGVVEDDSMLCVPGLDEPFVILVGHGRNHIGVIVTQDQAKRVKVLVPGSITEILHCSLGSFVDGLQALRRNFTGTGEQRNRCDQGGKKT